MEVVKVTAYAYRYTVEVKGEVMATSPLAAVAAVRQHARDRGLVITHLLSVVPVEGRTEWEGKKGPAGVKSVEYKPITDFRDPTPPRAA